MAATLMDYFNRQPRIGVLVTSSREGRVDCAVIGSARMLNEETVVVALGKNRSLAYLEENPHAVYAILEPGKGIMDWKGIRVYLRAKEIATSGMPLEEYKKQIANAIGEEAAKMIHAVVTFGVYEVRPIVDMGQGWEKSI
ncbi:MAG: pyridoxamine 5'-phosphate oxidase family protein [Methanomicrobiales archaeon]|nr:pyridoxamine 5'-phosphate oxidase family protein [Methanomicrobiales archaeon]